MDPRKGRTMFGDAETGEVTASASVGRNVVRIMVIEHQDGTLAYLSPEEARAFAAHLLATADRAEGTKATTDTRVPAELIQKAIEDGDEPMMDALQRAGMRFGVKPFDEACAECGHGHDIHNKADPKRPIDLSCAYHDSEGPCLCGGFCTCPARFPAGGHFV